MNTARKPAIVAIDPVVAPGVAVVVAGVYLDVPMVVWEYDARRGAKVGRSDTKRVGPFRSFAEAKTYRRSRGLRGATIATVAGPVAGAAAEQTAAEGEAVKE